ncbi:MSC_0624 family F1-like ATPase-associated membrane protein [Mycoplasma nasistruthionis]|uniref:Uncharacterized protein n=1 Tax=Mycoplasma nasistruthionis TaxID=353852 RepID=A0A5B7XW84_9MOLU|nr:hypothetical protein [Mycoplasma nasistruthionis]QCZ36745.1 hypothetical protein FG904_01830 [Mycoplasma nasistruthionis]
MTNKKIVLWKSDVKQILNVITLTLAFAIGLFSLLNINNIINQDFLSFSNLFKITDSQSQSRNFVVIYNFVILLFTALGSLLWNYRNISKLQIKLSKYLAFYISYVGISAVSFVLLNFFPYTAEKTPVNLLIASAPFLVLMLVNTIAESIATNIYKKAYPNYKLYLTNFVLATVFKWVLVGTLSFALFAFISINDTDLLFSNQNPFYVWMKQNVLTHSQSSVLITVAFSFVLVAYVFTSAGQLLISKQRNKLLNFSKSILSYMLVVLASFSAWMIINAFTMNQNDGILVNRVPAHLFWMLALLIDVLVLGAYTYVSTSKIIHSFNQTTKGFVLVFTLVLTTSILLTFKMFDRDKFNNFILVLLAALSALYTLVIWQLFVKQNSSVSNIIAYLILTCLAFASVLEGLNAKLLTSDPQNDVLNNGSLLFKVADLFIISAVSFGTLSLLHRALCWTKAIVRIFIYKRREKKTPKRKRAKWLKFLF